MYLPPAAHPLAALCGSGLVYGSVRVRLLRAEGLGHHTQYLRGAGL